MKSSIKNFILWFRDIFWLAWSRGFWTISLDRFRNCKMRVIQILWFIIRLCSLRSLRYSSIKCRVRCKYYYYYYYYTPWMMIRFINFLRQLLIEFLLCMNNSYEWSECNLATASIWLVQTTSTPGFQTSQIWCP